MDKGSFKYCHSLYNAQLTHVYIVYPYFRYEDNAGLVNNVIIFFKANQTLVVYVGEVYKKVPNFPILVTC